MSIHDRIFIRLTSIEVHGGFSLLRYLNDGKDVRSFKHLNFEWSGAGAGDLVVVEIVKMHDFCHYQCLVVQNRFEAKTQLSSAFALRSLEEFATSTINTTSSTSTNLELFRAR